jgi:hypothetical protein
MDGVTAVENVRPARGAAVWYGWLDGRAAIGRHSSRHRSKDVPMRRLLLPTCLLLFAACPASRAEFPGADPECCSTYPIYLCRPGFLSYPKPPYPLGPVENCTGCNHCGHDPAYGCGVITPNPYACCFYGVTLSNYGLVTPYHGPAAKAVPSVLPALPPVPAPPEKLPKPPER